MDDIIDGINMKDLKKDFFELTVLKTTEYDKLINEVHIQNLLIFLELKKYAELVGVDEFYKLSFYKLSEEIRKQIEDLNKNKSNIDVFLQDKIFSYKSPDEILEKADDNIKLTSADKKDIKSKIINIPDKDKKKEKAKALEYEKKLLKMNQKLIDFIFKNKLSLSNLSDLFSFYEIMVDIDKIHDELLKNQVNTETILPEDIGCNYKKLAKKYITSLAPFCLNVEILKHEYRLNTLKSSIKKRNMILEGTNDYLFSYPIHNIEMEYNKTYIINDMFEFTPKYSMLNTMVIPTNSINISYAIYAKDDSHPEYEFEDYVCDYIINVKNLFDEDLNEKFLSAKVIIGDKYDFDAHIRFEDVNYHYFEKEDYKMDIKKECNVHIYAFIPKEACSVVFLGYSFLILKFNNLKERKNSRNALQKELYNTDCNKFYTISFYKD